MAKITLKAFGGILPSVQDRSLPDSGAQTAHNLDLRYGDFRPQKGPVASVTTVADGTRSLFRTPSGTWLSSTNDVNYVNGQINDAETERVYLTGRSAYPEAWQGGVYRRLGVPQPTVAPATVVSPGDEFSDAEEAAFRKLFIDTAADAVSESDILLGNVSLPYTLPLPTFDPAYLDVLLHLRMNDAGDGVFRDSSRYRRTITRGPSASISVATDGPVTGGEEYGIFAGNSRAIYSDPINLAATERYRIDQWVRPDATWNRISGAVLNGVVTLFSLGDVESTTQSGTNVLMSKPDRSTKDVRAVDYTEASLFPAGTWKLITIINTDKFRVYVGGVLKYTATRTYGFATGLFGYTDQGSDARTFNGDMEEMRIMSGDSVVDGAFTPPTAPWPSNEGSYGIWIPHGTAGAVGLPTTETGDVAFAALMRAGASGLEFAEPRLDYLRDPSLGGAEITYEGETWWAVPFKYRAQAKDIDEAALLVVLEDIDDPTNPGTDLLDTAEAQEIADAVEALYDPSRSPVLGFVDRVNLIQNTIIARIENDALSQSAFLSAAEKAAAAASLRSIGDQLRSACLIIKEYYDSLDGQPVRTVLSTKYDELVKLLLPETVTRIVTTRAYVYTYVTDWGEESAPSPPSELIEGDQNDTVGITITTPPTGRNIVGWRLYRSSTTNVGAAYQLVADIDAANAVLDGSFFDYYDIGTLTLSDSQEQEELQETLQTLTWIEPDANMIGLVGMPNGVMAGFFGKTLCFSEPFAPYAWPLEYQLTLEYDIVGLGVFGQTLVVLTEGNPYYASGADSASMSAQKMESTQACSAKRTIVSMEGGVVYASPDGLCLAGPDGVSLLTLGAFEKADWETLDPANCFGGFHEGVYQLFSPEEIA